MFRNIKNKKVKKIKTFLHNVSLLHKVMLYLPYKIKLYGHNQNLHEGACKQQLQPTRNSYII
jgi:hypothetical protein